jgi:putative tricarboxylic transport membrane protein
MKADRIIFVCIVILAAIYFYAIEQIPTLQIGDPMGAKAIPRVLGLALLVAGGLLLLEMRLARLANKVAKAEQKAAEKAEFVEAIPEDKSQYWVVAAIVLWTIVYFIAFEYLGYAIASAIYLIVLMAYFNRDKWRANVLTAVLFSLGSYMAFTKLFDVQLAPGLLPF